MGVGPGAAVGAYPVTSWLFMAALVLFAVSVGYLVLNFTGHGSEWSQQRFLAWCLAPMVGGAIAMTLGWAEFPALVSLRTFVGWSAVVPALGWLVLGVITPRIFRRVHRVMAARCASTWVSAPSLRRWPRARFSARVRTGSG